MGTSKRTHPTANQIRPRHKHTRQPPLHLDIHLSIPLRRIRLTRQDLHDRLPSLKLRSTSPIVILPPFLPLIRKHNANDVFAEDDDIGGVRQDASLPIEVRGGFAEAPVADLVEVGDVFVEGGGGVESIIHLPSANFLTENMERDKKRGLTQKSKALPYTPDHRPR